MEKEKVYVVAGDEMVKLFARKYPEIRTVPFREDFSKGSHEGFSFTEELISQRSEFWGSSREEYAEKLSPVMDLDMNEEFVLCFGTDDCCVANLKFVTGYLENRGCRKPVHVLIVDELDLTVLNEYDIFFAQQQDD